MKITHVKGIRLKMLNAIREGQDSGKPVDYLTLTVAEYNEFREAAGVPMGQQVDNFIGTPIEVEKVEAVKRKAFNH